MTNPTLRFKNFGPFGENRDSKGNLVDDGFFTVEFSPVTVFIGPQASGKSTLLKLYSIFSGLEKRLENGDLNEYRFEKIPLKVQLKRHCIEMYMQEKTEIKYMGINFCVAYKDEVFSANRQTAETKYFMPEIQYVPTERNVLSNSRSGILSNYVNDFRRTYENALADLIDFSINFLNVGIEFDKEKRIVFINGKGYKNEISEVASGIQSVAPLLLASRNLKKKCNDIDIYGQLHDIDERGKAQIANSIKRLYKGDDSNDLLWALDAFLEFGDAANIADETAKKLHNILENYFNSCFINIVEEPEQNLFPETQAAVLYELLGYKNANPHNKLIFSTHSPYMISFLTQVVFAGYLKDKAKDEKKDELKKRIDEINPLLWDAAVLGENVKIYETKDGGMNELKPFGDKNLPNDEDFLNKELRKLNDNFDDLFDLEDEFVG